MKTSKVTVANMHCSACVIALEGIEDDLQGVWRVSASYAKQRLEVVYDPETVNEQQIIAAVKNLGCDLQVTP